MTDRHTVGCADIWSPEVKALIVEAVPPLLDLTFASIESDGEWREMLSRSEYLILGSERVDDQFFAGAPALKMIHRWGIGTDSIDRQSAVRAGVTVAITAGANSNAVAEHTLMLILACLRRLTLVDSAIRKNIWMYREMRSRALQLRGRTVGLVGFSNIGQAVARILRGFGTNVVYFDPRPAATEIEEDTGARYVGFEELLAVSDIVSLHCPGGGANRHLLNARTIALMKDGGIVINTARGDLIDEKALVAALDSGKISQAGLDVYEVEPLPSDSALLRSDKTCLTPHTAGSVLDDVTNVATHIFRNIQLHARGEPLPPQDMIV